MTTLALPNPNRGRPSAKDTGRCRLQTRCDGATEHLSLRRIRDGGIIRPMLCCDDCAKGRTP